MFIDLDTAPAGFLLFSEVGVIIDINATLLNLLNYPDKGLVIGQNTSLIFSVADRIFQQTHFLPLLRMQGHADEIFFQLKSREGKDVPVICNAVRKVTDSTAIIHCVFISAAQRSKYEQELLAARKEAQEALAKNSELIAAKAELEEKTLHLDRKLVELKKVNDDLLQFGKIISHDVQEPIRKIAVFTDKVAHDANHQLDATIIRQFEKINRECFVLRQLGAALERFISLNVHTEQPGLIDLNQLLSVAFKTAISTESKTSLNFVTGPLPVITGLERQLEMLFYNIFRNSQEFRSPERPLLIKVEHFILRQNLYQERKEAYRYVDFVTVIIRDNGTGFDQKEGVDYFTIQKKAANDGPGLSFGLAFAGKVVTNHHGFIKIESKRNEGTSVWISLPVNPE